MPIPGWRESHPAGVPAGKPCSRVFTFKSQFPLIVFSERWEARGLTQSRWAPHHSHQAPRAVYAQSIACHTFGHCCLPYLWAHNCSSLVTHRGFENPQLVTWCFQDLTSVAVNGVLEAFFDFVISKISFHSYIWIIQYQLKIYVLIAF